jgi:bacterioferritin-associated ferredoxin
MIVCQCHAVSDRKVRQCVRNGARTLRDVERSCGAGGGCGGCKRAVVEVMDRESERVGFSLLPVLMPA